MRFRLTFITGMSLMFMVLGVIMAFSATVGFLNKRFFFTAVGILGWFIGNSLIVLEDRIGEIEKRLAGEEPAAAKTF